MKTGFLTLLAALWLHSAFALTINIADRGAKGDGRTDNTAIIQQAIHDCRQGTLLIPAGNYLTGPLTLSSDIRIYLEFGATLTGIADMARYPKPGQGGAPALLFADNAANITIAGEGTIDGQGDHPVFQLGDDSKTGAIRPMLLHFINCRHIDVKDLHIRNSAYWVQKYEGCDDVSLRALKIYSHGNFNNDGIDISGSTNVIIADCYIDTDDDALCLKSEPNASCENISISNCVLRSNCNALKFGTGSHSGFKNIAVSNITIHKASEDNRRHWKKTFPWMGITADTTVISGIALEVVDGGCMDRVVISGVTMQDIQTPIFIRLGDRRKGPGNTVSTLKNVIISHIIASSSSRLSSSITGIPGHLVENVSISHVRILAPGGVQPGFNKSVPENIPAYPENRMFNSILPASAFYIRHAKNISFEDVQVQTQEPDARPAFVLDDVTSFDATRCQLNGVTATIVHP
ncbi:glycoside hydrolase family 28 protein [Chitinophaga qingshengii]|uniref:Glycoside hydrolase family 28 protein n=1 Tax=Chitinophaga qingshengii TaxID=1569794 RepID=A0ABR7THT2_9BACT|nr:glycosyl hydrolase family 28 protein [Chitinophaga qingshengii]MBC9930065.1 glycoside hydrolase family 28 protein [Chitinophaga qingshengii]